MDKDFLTHPAEIAAQPFAACHGGEGTLLCRDMLTGVPSDNFCFFHRDDMKKGVSIGEHPHEATEEIYYLLSGEGILTSDGEPIPFKAGDFSLCHKGHSHSFLATEDCVLIVVGVKG